MNAEINIKDCSIQTKRLIIRPLTTENLSSINNSYKEKETFGIFLKDGNYLIGAISLNSLNKKLTHINKTELLGINLDYTLLENYNDNDYESEILKAIISHCFFSRHLDFLICSHLENNDKTKEILVKSNFKFYTKKDGLNYYLILNYYKRNNCHCELCINSTNCLCSICPNKSFCLINHPIECKFNIN
jgi:RimJ/RimL family protein N-acetyltransferase